jgi:uncharacterized membrane protein YhaH (DUF805 family)
MTRDIGQEAPDERPIRGDLPLLWILVGVGLASALVCTASVFNENMYAYTLCFAPPRQGCGDGPWLSSMGLTFVGGVAAVAIAASLGVRRHKLGRTGFWFPLGALGVVGALTGTALVIVHIGTPS